ncbi:GH25 family lysozyme [Enterococcus sp. AZ109]|uniref:GH25 family lysozyme n=1 Tax=Enterococcus sp. AZ109 TaxID=2774634 RepID=UPI003F24BEEE
MKKCSLLLVSFLLFSSVALPSVAIGIENRSGQESSSTYSKYSEEIVTKESEVHSESTEVSSTSEDQRTEESVETEETMTSSSTEISSGAREEATTQSEETTTMEDEGVDPSNRSDLEQVRARASLSLPTLTVNSENPGRDFIDVSSHNGAISVSNYQIMKSYGVKGVSVKLTEGTSYRNPLAASQINNAKAAGLVVSTYHYSWFTSEAVARAEADYYANYANELGLAKDTMMINDIEQSTIIGTANHTDTSLAFEKRLNDLGFSRVNHYMGNSWLTSGIIDPNRLGYKKIWVASYYYSVTSEKKLTQYGAWQYSSQMTFPGVPGYFDISVDYASDISTKPNAGPPQGPWISDNRYVTFTKANQTLYGDFGWSKRGNTSDNLNKTFKSTGKYYHANGTTYLSIYDGQGKWLGYIEEQNIAIANNAQGPWISDNRYATFTKANQTLYGDFGWSKRGNTSDNLNKTFKSTGKYYHANGTTYLSIYDGQGKWLGYIEEQNIAIANNAQGPWISDNRYVTFTKANQTLYGDFGWSKRGNTSDNLNKTFKSTGKYYHANGTTYLSIYDGQGKWLGYIEEQNIAIANNAQGPWISDNRYVTFTKANQMLYGDFGWSKRGNTSDNLNKTFKSTGKYYHANGTTYLSIYDGQGKWLGYIEEQNIAIANNAQGPWISDNRYVTFAKANQTLYGDFGWSKRGNTSDNLNKTFKSTGKYYHANGTTYLSIYDGQGKWLGYIEEQNIAIANNAQGPWISDNRYVTFAKANQMLYGDFGWSKRGNTSDNLNKTFKSTGKYYHANGTTYLSIYDGQGKWLGYIEEQNVDLSINK